jgi:hypothetical protein
MPRPDVAMRGRLHGQAHRLAHDPQRFGQPPDSGSEQRFFSVTPAGALFIRRDHGGREPLAAPVGPGSFDFDANGAVCRHGKGVSGCRHPTGFGAPVRIRIVTDPACTIRRRLSNRRLSECVRTTSRRNRVVVPPTAHQHMCARRSGERDYRRRAIDRRLEHDAGPLRSPPADARSPRYAPREASQPYRCAHP